MNTRSAIVVAPHPDDETIAAFGLISMLRKHQTKVHVIVVTDGAASHRQSNAWPKTKLIERRQLETAAAMKLAGLDQANLSFLGLDDGGLQDLSAKDHKTIVRAVAQKREVDLLVVPDLSDAHPDHQAIGRVLQRYGGTRSIWTYKVWPPSSTPSDDCVCLDLGSIRDLKRQALRTYETQTGMITDDPQGFTITPELFDAFTGPVEYFRQAV
ncbi:MAG: PIG-L family deacetylase [Parvularcula sp.]|nr:PIG-L family deacetylase [Parvularcula sp.]